MFKNMKIKRKLILTCLIIALVASISGVVSVFMMNDISKEYNYALNNYGFAQGDVGKAMASFIRTDGNVHDAVSYFNEQDVTAAINNVPKWEKKFEEYMAAVDATIQTDEARNIYNAIMSDWQKYKNAASNIIAQGTKSDAPEVIQAAQQRMVNELDPFFIAIYDGLANLMAMKVDDGNALQATTVKRATVCVILVTALILVAVVLSLLFGTKVSNGIAKPMKLCCDRLDELSKGDLSSPVPDIHTKDEVGELARSTESIVECLSDIINDVGYLLGEMANGNFDIRTKNEAAYRGDMNQVLLSIRKINHSLSDALTQVTTGADQVAAGADQVAVGAQSLAQGATEQASAVEELSATIEDIANSAKKNAENSAQAMEHSNAAGEQVAESTRQMEQMVEAMGRISDSSEEIGKIIATIENIAFQTNILALNAAVEAARAGAAGKGFAVVADEVRNLASKSDQAAKATKELIERSVNAVQEGNSIVKHVSDALERTAEIAGRVVNDVQLISAAAAEESTAIEQVTEGMDQISSVVQTNSATSEESAAASQELTSQAAQMKQLLSKFKVRDMTGTASAAKHEQPSYRPAPPVMMERPTYHAAPVMAEEPEERRPVGADAFSKY